MANILRLSNVDAAPAFDRDFWPRLAVVLKGEAKPQVFTLRNRLPWASVALPDEYRGHIEPQRSSAQS
ncbi:MAG: hypothetical protein AAF215_05205 [Cyanobacteria bacterium P01_A01_bin.123]